MRAYLPRWTAQGNLYRISGRERLFGTAEEARFCCGWQETAKPAMQRVIRFNTFRRAIPARVAIVRPVAPVCLQQRSFFQSPIAFKAWPVDKDVSYNELKPLTQQPTGVCDSKEESLIKAKAVCRTSC